ncbi:hypothetical protein [Reyranella sp.]|nr:hypothetical protein [Reyranella sp.]
MTSLIRTFMLVLAVAMAGAVAGCSGIPQDDRYQDHRNPSWVGFRA